MKFTNLALIGLLFLGLDFQSEGQTDEFRAGIQFMLTHPYVLDRYGIETNADQTDCPKSTIFLVEDSTLDAMARHFDQKMLCVKGEKIDDIFYHSYDAYFKVIEFKMKKDEYQIKIELITPKYQPIGKNELFIKLHYKYLDQKIEVTQFEELIKQYTVKIKAGKEIKKDLLVD